jgi:hypothetical protein
MPLRVLPDFGTDNFAIHMPRQFGFGSRRGMGKSLRKIQNRTVTSPKPHDIRHAVPHILATFHR